MNSKLRMMLVLLVFCAGLFVMTNGAIAAKPVAKITAFKGEVVILSGNQFTNITQKGVVLNEGDRIQTKDGEAEVTFDDGAMMKLSPFTSTMIQEREEESGWLFKTKATARRLTVYVGKLWFNSGSSHKKNFVQTPSAVCGLRGTTVEVGYDNVKSYLNTINGETQTLGQFITGFFNNPGVDAATKSGVYNALVSAQALFVQAQQSGKPEDLAKAEVAALQAVVAAATALTNSPDPVVAKEASTALTKSNELIQQKQEQQPEVKELTSPPPPPVITLPENTQGTTTTSSTSSTTTSSSTTTTTAGAVSPIR